MVRRHWYVRDQPDVRHRVPPTGGSHPKGRPAYTDQPHKTPHRPTHQFRVNPHPHRDKPTRPQHPLPGVAIRLAFTKDDVLCPLRRLPDERHELY